jgi:hypothetical protein
MEMLLTAGSGFSSERVRYRLLIYTLVLSPTSTIDTCNTHPFDPESTKSTFARSYKSTSVKFRTCSAVEQGSSASDRYRTNSFRPAVSCGASSVVDDGLATGREIEVDGYKMAFLDIYSTSY